ncbi:hypothetical protein C9I36_18400 [Pectobacterium punjabense]|nr:hypothetical protein C9I36_18400 [Pectobacterium punjabense]
MGFPLHQKLVRFARHAKKYKLMWRREYPSKHCQLMGWGQYTSGLTVVDRMGNEMPETWNEMPLKTHQ